MTLSRESQSLLDAARGGDDPSALDRARVRAKLDVALKASAGSALALKVFLALFAAGAAVAGYLALSPPTRTATITAPPSPPPPTARVILPPPPVPDLPASLPPSLPAAPPAPHRHAPPPADTLAAERSILARASAALRAGDPSAALAAVAEHAKKFPNGVLVEERQATQVLALCAAGRTDEGARARDAFLTRWPHSVQAAHVRAACSR